MAFATSLLGQSHDLRRVSDLFESIDEEVSLEATVLRERAAGLKRESIKLARQRAFLREERRKTREDADAIQFEKAQIEKMRATGWSPATCLPGTQKDGSPPKTLRFNIGGQVFEASEAVLTRDKGSVLAALCLADSPMQLNEDGAFYFDRDWWLFRYILIFLRDGMLPEEKRLLVQLYREASFWNLESLRRAVEETQLSLGRKSLKLEASGEVKEADMEQGWWSTLPKWLEAEKKDAEKKGKKEDAKDKDKDKDKEKDKDGDKDKEKEKEKDKEGGDGGKGEESPVKKRFGKFLFGKKEAKKEEDWWTASEYKGKKYGILSSAPDKVVTDEKEEDAIPMLKTTWERPIPKAEKGPKDSEVAAARGS